MVGQEPWSWVGPQVSQRVLTSRSMAVLRTLHCAGPFLNSAMMLAHQSSDDSSYGATVKRVKFATFELVNSDTILLIILDLEKEKTNGINSQL